jgi:hypothetical protein
MGEGRDLRGVGLRSNPLPIVFALLAAAATSATVFVATDITLLLLSPGDGNSLGFVLETIQFLWPIGFVAALVHAVVLGLPAYLLARRLGWTRWWASLIGGFAVGSLPYAVLALPWGAPPPPDLVEAHVIAPFSWVRYGGVALGLGVLGMAGGFSAWCTWRRLGRVTSV